MSVQRTKALSLVNEAFHSSFLTLAAMAVGMLFPF